MKIELPSTFADDMSLEKVCGAALLGRLGRELAHVYGDVTETALPPKLQSLVDQLEVAVGRGAVSRPRG